MPSISDIQKVVADLGEKQIINPETKLKDLVSVRADAITDPRTLVGWYVAGGEHFVLVCGKEPSGSTVNPIAERPAFTTR